MRSQARRKYGEQLRLRKAGVPSSLGQGASLIEAKPHFYTDARLLIDSVREVYAGYRRTAPPYGLFDLNGQPFAYFAKGGASRWLQLEQLLATTAQRAFETVSPPKTGCPYHIALKNLGRVPLKPIVGHTPDVERLREITFPGAKFAPATIVNVLKRMPALAAANGALTTGEELARNSAHTLLSEPLHHPQQHAKAFTFCLADGINGTDAALDRGNFMPIEVIENYTKLGTNLTGQEAIEWSIPTTDFTLRAVVRVANRLEGPESELRGDHITVYPIGTRLGDIRTDEPTIGCPGSQLAYDMWEQTMDVIVGDALWE